MGGFSNSLSVRKVFKENMICNREEVGRRDLIFLAKNE